jgi:hypothetical protein
MVPWIERPTIEIDLDRPPGERYAVVPPEAYAAGRQLLAAIMAEVPAGALLLADWVRLRTAGRFQGEASGLARQVGVSWRQVMLANVCYDLVLATLGCSTVVLPTPRGPVVARNMDWWPEQLLARTSYLLRVHRSGELAFASAAWPGSIGVVTGMSARGFAVVLNAVIGPEGIRKTGYPVLLHLRRVVEEARDFDEALRLLSKQKLTTSALFTLAGSDNHQRVVIERTPTRFAQRWPERDEPLITTNDYRLLLPPSAHDGAEIYQTTCSRYDALCRFFAGHDPDREVEDAALLYILSDPTVKQSITAQHVLLRPRTGEVRLLVPRHLLE